MTSIDPAQEAFNQAQRSFRDKLKDPGLYKDILATTTMDEVYDAAIKIQEDLAGRAGIRHLAKIRPFLDCLSAYARVIEVFIQAKPELGALIWGPVKLLLLWSYQVTAAFDTMVDAMARIGHALRQFAEMVNEFETSDVLKAGLALFYEDILDFYRISLDFFRKKRWKQLFDSVWPVHAQKINVVVNNLDNHSLLIRTEVTFLDIMEARKARQLSFQQFDNVRTSLERQKFSGLKSRISPDMYDDQLDWFRNRSVANCEKWLLNDPAFCAWLDVSIKYDSWFWLYGIPGAGKTYLSAAVVNHARKQHRTLFAFISHIHTPNLTARSVMQSFIFQAAEEDTDFQLVLIDSKERELRGSTDYAAELLKNFLSTAGPTYIIIDGLDEMDHSERQILLTRLDEISKTCKELRILLCSRSEADISKILEQKAKIRIRIDERNSGSIQNYVTHKTNLWMSSLRHDASIKSELRQLLSPLSADAKGMFMYARIVLDNLEHINSLEEIRRELKAPPSDLNAAYSRVFQRINAAERRDRTKRRKILGWMGCAPIPMTIYEMKQALLVDTDSSDEGAKVPSDLGDPNFPDMCGPIIEIVGDKLQFVHFTVQEYIFSKDIKDYISLSRATEDLTSVFLAYLSSGVLDMEADEEDVRGEITIGTYGLFEYACFYWPKLLRQLDGIPAYASREHSRFIHAWLNKLVQEGSNGDFQRSVNQPRARFNAHLQRRYPVAYDSVCEAFQFHTNENRWGWNWSNSDSWIDLDPLNTSRMLVKIKEQFEVLLPDDGFSARLNAHYGPCRYKCTYLACMHSRRGFATMDERDIHVQNHERPVKCSLSSCEFSTIGFNSKKALEEHWFKVHWQASTQLSPGDRSEFEMLSLEEAQPLLFGLVAEGDVNSVQRLMSSSAGKRLDIEAIASARLIAARTGSLAMTKLLAPGGERYLPSKMVAAAVVTEDLDFANWAIPMTEARDIPKLMKRMLGVKSEKIYSLWEDFILGSVKRQRRESSPDNDTQPSAIQRRREHDIRRKRENMEQKREQKLIDKLFKQPIFTDMKGSPIKEARLQHTLTKLRNHIPPQMLGIILVRIAKSSCTLCLVKELVRLGAPINYPRQSRPHQIRGAGTGMTALQAAAKKTTKEAALLMQFLIMHGADARGVDVRTGLDNEPGPRNIARYLGIEWNDLLQKQRIILQQAAEKRGRHLNTGQNSTK